MDVKSLFNENLERIHESIRSADDLEHLLRGIGDEICATFEADRLTIYVVNEDRTLIVSKVKTGLDSFEDIKLPISAEYSIAGYVARNRQPVNIADVYDVEELSAYRPPVYFLRDVDKSTGYRTKQVLVAPIIKDAGQGEVIGVVQLINTRSGIPFSKAAEKAVLGLCETLAVKLAGPEVTMRYGRKPGKTKYDYLVLDGVMTAAELELAIRRARVKDTDIEQMLLKEFEVTEAALGRALAKFYGVPYEPFRSDRVMPHGLTSRINLRFLKNQNWLPIDSDDENIVILTTDPAHVMSTHIVNQVFPKKKISYCVCTTRELAATIDQFFEAGEKPPSIDTINRRLGDQSPDPWEEAREAAGSDSAVVQLVNNIVVAAHKQQASDIHIEPRPGKGKSKVRFRIDGTLSEYTEIPVGYHENIVTRLKIMADLDISNKREPQDGKIVFKQFFSALDVELRIACIPTSTGKENVVLRLLQTGKSVPLDQLGLSPRNLEVLQELVSKPYGLFLVCGPTGSGKTTTLHSIIDHIDTPGNKIWTAEDPVEITHETLSQVQINPRVGLTFARAMRAFLRADPDVIMVGEMRDRETAAIGVEASLTGHLVFATIHTNSAAESILRLLEMGMDPFNFSDALLGIMAQRLARRLCPKCKKPRVAAPDEVRLLLHESSFCPSDSTDQRDAEDADADEATYAQWLQNYGYDGGRFILYEPTGCEACRGTGFNGRVALHELLVATSTIKMAIQEQARVSEILEAAMQEGMRTLKQDGVEKVLQGLTTMQSIRAVCA